MNTPTSQRMVGKVALVTGAASGIGKATAQRLWASTDMWPKQVAESGGQDAALKALVAEQGFAEPEEVAGAVLFLASDDARHVTGADLPVDDGFAIT